FNLFGAALLTRMIAAQAGYESGELVWTGGDTHLYLNHAELVAEQLSRQPSGEPRLRLKRQPRSVFEYRIEDFEVIDYQPQGTLRAPVAVSSKPSGRRRSRYTIRQIGARHLRWRFAAYSRSEPEAAPRRRTSVAFHRAVRADN